MSTDLLHLAQTAKWTEFRNELPEEVNESFLAEMIQYVPPTNILDLLLERGANINDCHNHYPGLTLSVMKGDMVRLNWFLKNGANVNVLSTTKDPRTPLMHAVMHSLRERHQDSRHSKPGGYDCDICKNGILANETFYFCSPCSYDLCSNCYESLEAETKKCRNGHELIPPCPFLERHELGYSMVKALLNAGANVNEYTVGQGNNILMLALMFNANMGIIKLILDTPSLDLNYKNHNDLTALEIAEKCSRSETVISLIKIALENKTKAEGTMATEPVVKRRDSILNKVDGIVKKMSVNFLPRRRGSSFKKISTMSLSTETAKSITTIRRRLSGLLIKENNLMSCQTPESLPDSMYVFGSNQHVTCIFRSPDIEVDFEYGHFNRQGLEHEPFELDAPGILKKLSEGDLNTGTKKEKTSSDRRRENLRQAQRTVTEPLLEVEKSGLVKPDYFLYLSTKFTPNPERKQLEEQFSRKVRAMLLDKVIKEANWSILPEFLTEIESLEGCGTLALAASKSAPISVLEQLFVKNSRPSDIYKGNDALMFSSLLDTTSTDCFDWFYERSDPEQIGEGVLNRRDFLNIFLNVMSTHILEISQYTALTCALIGRNKYAWNRLVSIPALNYANVKLSLSADLLLDLENGSNGMPWYKNSTILCTNFMIACLSLLPEDLKSLLARSDSSCIQFRSQHGFSAFLLASILETNQGQTVKVLLEAGANVEDATINGNTALIFACVLGSLDIIKVLIEHKCPVKAQNIHGMNALMYFIKKSTSMANEEILPTLKLLVEAGAKVTTKNADGLDAYELALNTYPDDEDNFPNLDFLRRQKLLEIVTVIYAAREFYRVGKNSPMRCFPGDLVRVLVSFGIF